MDEGDRAADVDTTGRLRPLSPNSELSFITDFVVKADRSWGDNGLVTGLIFLRDLLIVSTSLTVKGI